MKFKVLVLLAIVFTFSNCQKEETVSSLNQVKMCNQVSNGSNLCNSDNPVFSPIDQTFFVTAVLRDASESDFVTFSWYGILPDGQAVFIDDISIRAGDFGTGNKFDLKASLTRGNDPWPVGNYEVEIALDNGTKVVKGFTVI